MKKTLATLIKLQKSFVDEQRQQLARLLEHLDGIEREITQLEILKAREQDAAKDPITRMTYGAFLRAVLVKERKLEEQRQQAVSAVQVAQDKLMELFEEQKRYEIAEEQRKQAEEKEERRVERIELDEVGGVRHRRMRYHE